MKLCPKCFKQNPPDAEVCSRCRSVLAANIRTCPAGLHPMEPGWSKCGYCLASTGNPDDPSPIRPDWQPQPPKPVYTPAVHAPTVFAPPAPAVQERKIVGVLLTYTWKAQGRMFAILEGRNLIGSDRDQCEIAIAEDGTLSPVNTHITFRKNFIIGDMPGSGGTYVDGEPIEGQFRPLRSYARIVTGCTLWIFMAAEPA